MEICEYEERWHGEVCDLVLSIQNDEYGIGLPLEEQPDLVDIKGSFSNGGRFWAALKDGRVVGCIGLMRKTPTGGVLKKFFVSPSVRGEGVGLALYQTLEAFCQAEGITTLVLDTPSVATRSHRFYRRAGFVEVTRSQLPFPYDYPDRDSLLFLKVMPQAERGDA